MENTLKGALTKADDIQRMKYLLAKYDLDDLQAALVIIYQHLMAAELGASISLYVDKIEIICETDSSHTEMTILLQEEKLTLIYNLHGTLELFDKKTECDTSLVKNIIQIICDLSFYKTDESSFYAGNFSWIRETYSIDVIRRKP